MRPGQHKRVPNHVIGLILVALVAVGSYLAYTKKLPWSHGYEVKAVFTTAENVRPKSPVRIAGVNVGEVTSVEPCTNDNPACGGVDGGAEATASTSGKPSDSGGANGVQAAIVTMEIDPEGQPIKDDATFKLRPRLFLEGNLFVDVNPGSPESPEASSDHTFPVTQTSAAVQLDQVLTTLQSGVRQNLQIFLKEFGNALVKYGGAEGFREFYKTSPGAYKYTSLVNQAYLGTQPHDLSNLVRNLDSAVQALDADQTRPPEPGHEPAGGHRLLRCAEPGAVGCDRPPAATARGRQAGARGPRQLVPAAASVRARGAAGDALHPGDARRRHPAPQPDPQAGVEARAARPEPGPPPHDPEADQALAPHDPVPEPVAVAGELLQPDDHPVVQLERPGQRTSRRQRSRTAPERIRRPSPRRPATGWSASAARAAPATPTASTSASRPAAASTRRSSQGRCRDRRAR